VSIEGCTEISVKSIDFKIYFIIGFHAYVQNILPLEVVDQKNVTAQLYNLQVAI